MCNRGHDRPVSHSRPRLPRQHLISAAALPRLGPHVPLRPPGPAHDGSRHSRLVDIHGSPATQRPKAVAEVRTRRRDDGAHAPFHLAHHGADQQRAVPPRGCGLGDRGCHARGCEGIGGFLGLHASGEVGVSTCRGYFGRRCDIRERELSLNICWCWNWRVSVALSAGFGLKRRALSSPYSHLFH